MSELSNTLQSEKIIFRTMISSTEALRLAHALEQAEQNAVQMPVISAQIEKMSFQDAYAVQDAWVNLKTENGADIVGYIKKTNSSKSKLTGDFLFKKKDKKETAETDERPDIVNKEAIA